MYGLFDRGVLAPGYRADINVIDYDNLTFDRPAVAPTTPAGGGDDSTCERLPRYVLRRRSDGRG